MQTQCSIRFGSLDFVGTVIHSTHNANRVFYKLWKLVGTVIHSTHNECSISFGSLGTVIHNANTNRVSFGSLDFVGTVIHSTHNECSISFGSLDFVGTVIHSTHNAHRVLWKLRLCRDSNTQYTQRKQSVL